MGEMGKVPREMAVLMQKALSAVDFIWGLSSANRPLIQLAPGLHWQ